MIKRLLVLCLALSGCSLYWGGDDDDVCNGVAYPEGGASQGLRNPDTGTCEYQGGGGGYYCCGDSCTDEGYGYGADVPARDWGVCDSYCDALDEGSCINTTGCHAAYLDQGLDALVPYTTFLGCWATAPYTSSTLGTCTGLDAQGCSERDTCSMVYYGDSVTLPQKFEQCIDEQYAGCGIDIGCPTGSHCEQQCEPCDTMGCQDTCYPTCVQDTTCASIDCGPGYQCVQTCEDSGDSAFCDATCVPTGTDPGQCTGTVMCTSAPPTCPANSTPGIANGCWTGYCIPNAACGGQDPGQCYAPATCGSAPPSCPTGTLPGVLNGCWSGYCIPTYGCEIAACETLTTEAACSGRWDCTPVYLGTDCTCTMTGGCTCTTETYERCESTVMPL